MGGDKYQLVKTEDGTYTVLLKDYEEAMHSLSGAYEEAVMKHVLPSNILYKKKDSLFVLDVGFGLGYNVLALIVELNKQNYDGLLNIISFELEDSMISIMDHIKFGDMKDRYYDIVKKAYSNRSYHHDKIIFSIEFGDARVSVKKLNDYQFDAVFFDPFSPAKNPDLWSVDFFKEIFRLITDDGILTTYSSAPQVRTAMLLAGFLVGRGPAVGRKKEGTVAAKSKIIRSLDNDELKSLKMNSRSIPYRDSLLNDSRINIINRRADEIRRMKEKN